MMQLFPNNKMSLRCIDLRARPNSKCSPAWARNNATYEDKNNIGMITIVKNINFRRSFMKVVINVEDYCGMFKITHQ